MPLSRATVFAILLVFVTCVSPAQNPIRFRSGIFLHHSTGECIWGPNESSTSVPQEISAYNALHGLVGADSVTLGEQWWPDTHDNEWATWHRIFDNQLVEEDIRPYLQNNAIVVIKSCFPSSSIAGIGGPSDTLDPDLKSVWNFKWHWRNIVRVMRQHPENFFVIWTNAPLVAGATDDVQAALASAACRWAKDTLANGLDSQFGAFPRNVYVFDFFHKLADSSGKLPLQYATSETDSHPNAAATALVAPQFVREIFDAAIGYEGPPVTVEGPASVTEPFSLSQNYPNPFNPSTTIEFSIPHSSVVILKVCDLLGKEVATLANEVKQPGTYTVQWDASRQTSGVYFYRLQADAFMATKKLLMLR